MGSKTNWYQTRNRLYYIPKVSKFCLKWVSMFIGLKVPSLACKCVFYRKKQNAMGGMNFESL